jgi:hypothetical protein
MTSCFDVIQSNIKTPAILAPDQADSEATQACVGHQDGRQRIGSSNESSG